MTNEKLRQGNYLEMEIVSVSRQLKDFVKAKNKINLKETDTFTDNSIDIRIIGDTLNANPERLLKYVNNEIDVLTKEVKSLKDKFNKL